MAKSRKKRNSAGRQPFSGWAAVLVTLFAYSWDSRSERQVDRANWHGVSEQANPILFALRSDLVYLFALAESAGRLLR
jgi:hypothetical protein